MKMEDGNFLSLSVAIGTIAVFVRPRSDSMDGIAVLSEIQILDAERRSQLSRDERSKEDEALLFELRKAIGWPKTLRELRDSLERTGNGMSKHGFASI